MTLRDLLKYVQYIEVINPNVLYSIAKEIEETEPINPSLDYSMQDLCNYILKSDEPNMNIIRSIANYIDENNTPLESQGFKYKINSDNKTCSIINIGTCTDKNLFFPQSIDGHTVTKIDTRAFQNEQSILSIQIPGTVKDIGLQSFQNCNNLSDVIIGEGVKFIYQEAFLRCNNLQHINIPSSMHLIGSEAFGWCKKLTDIIIPSNTKLNSNAFSHSGLESIKICDGIDKSGISICSDCTFLTKVILPNTLTHIEDEAFIHCTSLSTIKIPDSVIYIGSQAFTQCPLTTIIIGENVQYIQKNNFGEGTISKVYYRGTKESWNNITIDSGNSDINNEDIRYYYSETQPTGAGKYWHYVDNVPTKW